MSKSSQRARDNRANQLNPNHPAFYQSRGVSPDEAQRKAERTRPALGNRANQFNPNSAVYVASRAEPKASASSSNPSPAKPE